MARFWQVFIGVILALIVGHLLLDPAGVPSDCPSVIERYLLRDPSFVGCDSAAPRFWLAVGIFAAAPAVSGLIVADRKTRRTVKTSVGSGGDGVEAE